MRNSFLSVLLTSYVVVVVVVRGAITECPHDWEAYETSCYKFMFYPLRTYVDAELACESFAASLVSIDDLAEHTFISGVLQKSGGSFEWYTSGVVLTKLQTKEKTTDVSLQLIWQGDGTDFNAELQNLLATRSTHTTEEELESKGNIITYKYITTPLMSYGFGRSRGNVLRPFICEIPLGEVYRIFEQRREFDYGVDIVNLNDVPRGPKITEQPRDLIVLSNSEAVHVDCVAMGNPMPTYKWFLITDRGREEISSKTLSRYTLTGGRFTITKPNAENDTGIYQCQATNDMGSTISNEISIGFGELREFSNVARDVVRVHEYKGAMIECQAPFHKPGVSYQWFRETPENFVRPEHQTYIFISDNGKIYFSEVSKVDEGNYHCVVTLGGPYDEEKIINYQGKYQSPSRTSMAIPLFVMDAGQTEWGPQIQDDFIQIMPQTPLRGQDVKLECFAYGTMPIYYSWSRVGAPMPSKTQYLDSARFIVIPNVQFQDSGTYRCMARRNLAAYDVKEAHLKVAAKPYFDFPLTDQHLDVGGELTWRCAARAVPAATYVWYKNGVQITPEAGVIEINRFVLRITALDASRDNGTYQCSATNVYGTTVTSAELRVLSFAPSFQKNPIPNPMHAADGGNATIPCRPEAAPFPDFTWQKDGMDLPISTTPGRLTLLANGDLFISPVQMSDGGIYTCTATNLQGSASSSGYLEVQQGISINTAPSPRTVLLNDTEFLPCVASYARGTDMVYVWLFNGKTIDVDNDPFFGWGAFTNSGGLYIRNIQFEHDGLYTCVAQSVTGQARAEAQITVSGPPAAPAGVYCQSTTITAVSLMLRWTATANHGQPVTSYIIEVYPVLQKRWRILAADVDDAATIVENEDKRGYIVQGLKPGNMYQFRLLSVNVFGVSEPSQPSLPYLTNAAPPTTTPIDLGGGGGSVGTLTMTWTPLDREDLNGKGTGYAIYWRRKGGQENDWSKNVEMGNANKSVSTVGKKNFYLEYEVKIQAFNMLGSGPNSSIATIFSAEDMPIGIVTDVGVEGYNETTMSVSWTTPDTLHDRDYARGKVIGFQINCWPGGISTPGSRNMPTGTDRIAYASADDDSVLVLGAINGLYYFCVVQVRNSAGLGPASDSMTYSSNDLAPLTYPTWVEIHSYSWDSVKLCYRGVITSEKYNAEEPLIGYRARHWLAGDDIRTATVTECGRKEWCIVSGLEQNNLYNLRMFAYSYGGDGKMSPTMIFTMGGAIRLDLQRYELLARGSLYSPTSGLLVLSCILFVFFSY